MSGLEVTYHQDLCHAGNDRGGNAGLTPDCYDRPADEPMREAIHVVYFTCASEASPPVSFPCTGSKHVHPNVEIVCTCRCHVVEARAINAGTP